MPTSAKQLFDSSVDQVRRGQLRPALTTLLDTLAIDPAHVGALEAAGRICRLLGSSDDADLFDALRARPQEANALFALAYRMVDEGRSDVAVTMLDRALAADPESAPIRRELAFARLQTHDFAGCLKTLAPLQESLELSETERLEVLLLAAEAAFYARKITVCRQILAAAEELLPDDDQRDRIDALHGQLGRSTRWPSLEDLGLREWHFIQHAGVILKTAGGYFEDGSRQGRYDVLDLRLDMVAFLLQRLVHLFERLGLEQEIIVPVSDVAAPLAHALADRLGLPCVPDLEERGARPALLVAASAGEFAPIAPSLARNRPELRVFSLNLDWERDAPVCPEVAGVLARRVLLPWEERYAIDEATKEMRSIPADGRPAEELGAELIAAMDALPDDGGEAREEFESFYMPLVSMLVLDNEERYPHRRRFTALSPCWKPPVAEGEDEGDDDGGPA
ncbi:MAG: tetratricopeptide repeat protein [Planctomycetota bacterium]|jgi:tetratricopeptide (TPR) repeat protein